MGYSPGARVGRRQGPECNESGLHVHGEPSPPEVEGGRSEGVGIGRRPLHTGNCVIVANEGLEYPLHVPGVPQVNVGVIPTRK